MPGGPGVKTQSPVAGPRFQGPSLRSKSPVPILQTITLTRFSHVSKPTSQAQVPDLGSLFPGPLLLGAKSKVPKIMSQVPELRTHVPGPSSKPQAQAPSSGDSAFDLLGRWAQIQVPSRNSADRFADYFSHVSNPTSQAQIPRSPTQKQRSHSCVRICTYESVRAGLYLQTRMYESVRTGLYVRVCMYGPVHTNRHVRTCTYDSVCTILYVHICMQSVCACLGEGLADRNT